MPRQSPAPRTGAAQERRVRALPVSPMRRVPGGPNNARACTSPLWGCRGPRNDRQLGATRSLSGAAAAACHRRATIHYGPCSTSAHHSGQEPRCYNTNVTVHARGRVGATAMRLGVWTRPPTHAQEQVAPTRHCIVGLGPRTLPGKSCSGSWLSE